MDSTPAPTPSVALLSPGGTSVMELDRECTRLVVGSTDGIWLLDRDADGEWAATGRGLEGTFVSALVRTNDGAMIAGTHHFGIARSDDEGCTWRWVNEGLTHFDVWCVKCELMAGKEVLFAGTMPAHLFRSLDGGHSWQECTSLLKVESAPQWSFPPPPHLGHVKDVAFKGENELLVGIEVGALLRSRDGGETFDEIAVNADFNDNDIHRILVNASRPDLYVLATGWGLKISEAGGASWRDSDAVGINYPDAMVMHPDEPDLMFVAGAQGIPPNWYKINRSRPRLARTRDGGRTWERLLGGFPAGQRAVIGAMSLVTYPGGYTIFAGDTDGQIWQSRDGGDSWFMVCETGPLSKGEQYRGLVKGRPPAADLDNLKFTEARKAHVEALRA